MGWDGMEWEVGTVCVMYFYGSLSCIFCCELRIESEIQFESNNHPTFFSAPWHLTLSIKDF